jgi:hypothetical protein
MLAALLIAADAAEKSKAPFYILAGCLIGYAVLLSFVGITRHATFPPSRGLATVLILVCAGLVAGTMFTAVYTA